MKKENRIPWLAALLIILASFRFETHTTATCWKYDGAASGLFVVVIIGIILLFNLTTHWVYYLLLTGKLQEKPRFRFDVLILVAIISQGIGYTARGNTTISPDGSSVPSWLFQWGQSPYNLPFVISVIALALLLRVHTIVKALAESRIAANKPTGNDSH